MNRADCTALILCSLCVGCLAFPGRALAQSRLAVQAKSMYHDDQSHTESVRDVAKRQLTETSFNNSGLVLTKSVLVLNDSGLPAQGLIYDGLDNVVGRCQFYFDDFGRTIEQRKSNLQGQVYERIIQGYDASGQPKDPQLVTYPQNSPRMRTSTIDFTGTKNRHQVGDFAPSQARASQPRPANRGFTPPPPDTSPASSNRGGQNPSSKGSSAQPGKPLEIITVTPGR